LKFFFDTCVSSRIVRALKIIAEYQGFEIVHLDDKFKAASTPDPEWLSALSKEGDWIIISGDPKISRSKAERAAWKEAGLTTFFLTDGWGNRNLYDQTAELIRRWPDIVRVARECTKGSGFLIKKSKDFVLLSL
jgi:hypothetical protein